MLPNAKLYVLVRGDIPPGYQLAQSCHATFRFAAEHPEITAEWMEKSEYICCLATSNLEELEVYLKTAEANGIPCSAFYEPDIGDQLTAIALAPMLATKAMCADLPLALRGVHNEPSA